tara:strand:- start:199 stop:396 length:198 start_codon:yes stop_codon:yes gene_type:complete
MYRREIVDPYFFRKKTSITSPYRRGKLLSIQGKGTVIYTGEDKTVMYTGENEDTLQRETNNTTIS